MLFRRERRRRSPASRRIKRRAGRVLPDRLPSNAGYLLILALRCNRLPRSFGALDIFIGEAHGISRIEDDSDRRHVADIAVRGAGRDQQKIASFEHVFSLVGQRRAPAGELKRNFVLAKTTVIDSLRIRTVRGFDHDVGIFNQLEMLAAGAAFLDFIEHRRRFEEGASVYSGRRFP